MIAIAAALCAAHASAGSVGLRLDAVQTPHHATESRVAIWSPAAGSGTSTVFGENPVFRGVRAVADADVAAGPHPVVLLSHGMGGGLESTAWLAHGLAARGAIVIAVAHLNSTRGAFDLAKSVEHWTRAQDLSHALDVVLADTDIGPQADLTTVMAAGFSYGGWTALSLAGVRGDHAGLSDACAARRDMAYCDALLTDGLGLPRIAPETWNSSYADPRVTHAAAIDPGLAWGLDAGDVAALTVPTLLIGLGAGDDRLDATDFDASSLAALASGADVLRIAPATHFTAMPLCQPAGAAILAEERDDPVCTDPPGADRAAIHRTIIDAIARRIGL